MRAYIFPGQGAQQKGMGASLFDEFADLTRSADSILGYSIKDLCREDPDGLLGQTQYTQPAMYVVNALSYYQKLRETGLVPDFVAGHSLGEYNALLAAEVFDFETGLRLVRKRGELMGRASGGGMAAVLNASESEIRTILAENGLDSVDLANFNTPSQVVISGRAEDIEAAKPLFQTGNHLFMPLRTSGAFHSRYMEPARVEFEDFLAGMTFSKPRIPVVSNVTARVYEDHLVKENLTKQMVQAVRWSDTMEHLLAYSGMEFEEIGHGNVLTKLLQKIRRELKSENKPLPRVAQTAESAGEMVRNWNERYAIGNRFRSTTGNYGHLETATPAAVLFGHRAAVYMQGYRGYFDLQELEPVPAAQ
ncbi:MULTISPECIES: ACP S-malonyltransferase [unclassified Streptomyces]|uniref:ACP S-malonyltransferase n=1 Tax=unclassified Streptomyces TaxID=2593676 RepID=UPI001BE7C334|nr:MULTISPECIES: ACP S-malonyltransferase [unclassified Streptomyces]MBT2404438.1 ACP S-malonyltransferase [Streptomyces sp. ISL-21]MBT2459203.1 ACP S-malonyltransferase [Streptomyces sp. ISL-86]MBT2612508.1 ACP S-malonyltransferase [Streptomyces sp. ISL-87]